MKLLHAGRASGHPAVIQTRFRSTSHTTAICHSRITGQHYTCWGASDQGLFLDGGAVGSDSAAGNTQTKGCPHCKPTTEPELLLSRRAGTALKRILGCISARCLPPTHHHFCLQSLWRTSLFSPRAKHASAVDLSFPEVPGITHRVGKGREDALLAATHQMNSAARKCTTHCEIFLLKHKAAYQGTHVLHLSILAKWFEGSIKSTTKKTRVKRPKTARSVEEEDDQLQQVGLCLPQKHSCTCIPNTNCGPEMLTEGKGLAQGFGMLLAKEQQCAPHEMLQREFC